MGLFSRKNKKNEPPVQQNQEQDQNQNQDQKMPEMDPTVRPGGVFIMQLLMKEHCDMPSPECMIEVLSKYLGEVKAGSTNEIFSGFFAMDYLAQFKDSEAPVSLMINQCDEFQADQQIDEMKRSQMWDCRNDRDRILSECKYHVMVNDMLGGGLPSKVRANMLMDYLEALLELYPSCEAVYFRNSGKLILADEIRQKKFSGLIRFIKYAVNARFVNIMGTEDSLVDTLGLSLLFIEDLQYHFHGMELEPGWVVEHAYNMALYLLENDAPIKEGDTIDGIEDGRIVQHIQWPCHFENAMLKPERAVLDVCMGEYAAGNRQYN